MKNLIAKKINRLLTSKNSMKIFHFFHYLLGGFNSKKIEVSFEDKKSRLEIIQNIINRKKYQSYLEIGTFKDELFGSVNCNYKIGVDPVSGGNVRKTSDDFFSTNNEKFDLIFIDGLHHYEQVKKDIINSINALNEKGIILMHDCLPRDYYYQAVPRSQYDWNGDTWKAFLEFRVDENVDSYCCYADQGIGIIIKRKNRNKLNIVSKNFKKFNFNTFASNYREYLNLINYDELIQIIDKHE